MKATFLSRVVGVMGLMAVTQGAACSHADPEGFCQSWVESTCQAITSCCQSGMQFDMDACRLGLSQSCQENTGVAAVESGEKTFDSAAASACLGTVTSCSDAKTPVPDTYAQQQACANMLTGHTPVGAACNGAGSCAQAGDFSVCYGAVASTPTSPATGVCAQAVLDKTTCSFSFSTSQLHMCPDGMFCDRTVAATTTSTEPPSQEEFEFSAPCKPYVAAGGDCMSTSGATLPCASGLFCQVTFQPSGANTATCTPLLAAGAACQPGAAGGCDTGLSCSPGTSGMWTCQASTIQGDFCYTPPKCGDGICQPSETHQSCPVDCGCTLTCMGAGGCSCG